MLRIDLGTGAGGGGGVDVCVSPPNIWVIVQHRLMPKCNIPIKNWSPTILGK